MSGKSIKKPCGITHPARLFMVLVIDQRFTGCSGWQE
jgi:hypothetical protein